MSLSARPSAAMFALFFASCTSQTAASDPQCAVLVKKISECDESSSQMPASARARLLEACTPIKKCADIDTSSAEGCGQFMGCLYDPG